MGWLPLPHLHWLTYRRMGTHHPFPSGPSSFVIFSPSSPHIGQWTHPFCGTVPSHKSMDSVDLSICVDSSHCGWKRCLEHSWLILGTLFRILTLPTLEPPVSGDWTFLTQRPPPAHMQVLRGERTLRCQFHLHISACPCPCGTFFSGPGPNPVSCSPAVLF